MLANMKKGNGKIAARDFKRVQLSELRQGRRSKHHDAITPIVEEIAALADGEAITIPLDAVDIPLANLRSALVKATASRGLKISTYSDDPSLYVWRKTAGSRPYERAARNDGKSNKTK
jgi:hypothetical protein